MFAFGSAPYVGGGPITQDGASPTDFSAFAAATRGDGYDENGYILADRSRSFLVNFGNARNYGLGSDPADTSPLAGLTSPEPGYQSYWAATQAGGVYLQSAHGQTAC